MTIPVGDLVSTLSCLCLVKQPLCGLILYTWPSVWLDFQMSLSQRPVEPGIVSYLLFLAAMIGQTPSWLSAINYYSFPILLNYSSKQTPKSLTFICSTSHSHLCSSTPMWLCSNGNMFLPFPPIKAMPYASYWLSAQFSTYSTQPPQVVPPLKCFFTNKGFERVIYTLCIFLSCQIKIQTWI